MKHLIVLICTIAISFYGTAQESYSFSLEQAIEYGLEFNTDYLNAQIDAEIQREKAFEVMTEGFPKINGKLDYNYYFEQQVSIIPAGSFGPLQTEATEVTFQQPHSATLQVEAQQLVFDARYIYGLKAINGFYQMADAQVELGRINAEEQITMAYYAALVSQRSYDQLATNEKVLNQILYETRKTYEEGLTDELAVNRLELNVSNLETQIARAQKQAQNALLNLKFSIGMSDEDELTLTGTLEDLFNKVSFSESISANAENRVENTILNTQYDMKTYDIKQARSSYFPSLYAFASYGTLAQRATFDFFNTSEQWFDFGLVGFTLNIPIFDGLKAKSQVQQRKLDLQKIENQIDQFQRSVELEVAVAANNLQNAINEYNTQVENVALAQKILNKTVIMFNEGIGSSFELSNAQQELTTSQINHAQAVYNMLVAQFDLNKALGNI